MAKRNNKKLELTQAIQAVIERSTDWAYNGEDEYEVIDPMSAAENVINYLINEKLIKL